MSTLQIIEMHTKALNALDQKQSSQTFYKLASLLLGAALVALTL